MDSDIKCSSCQSYLIDSNDAKFIEFSLENDADPKFVHISCFKCSRCGEYLSSKGQEIHGSSEEIQRFLCHECFKIADPPKFCRNCAKRISCDDDYYVQQWQQQSADGHNDTYHHMDCLQPICHGCQLSLQMNDQPIEYIQLEELSLIYHRNCLKCSICHIGIKLDASQSVLYSRISTGKLQFNCENCLRRQNLPSKMSSNNLKKCKQPLSCSLRSTSTTVTTEITPKTYRNSQMKRFRV